MADYRFGSVLSAGGAGPDYRFDDVLFASLGTRTVGNITVDSGTPGQTGVVIPLGGGAWDGGPYTVTLNGTSIASYVTDYDATSITLTVPTPYAEGVAAGIDLLNLNVVYDLVVDDSAENPTTGQFRIDAPAQPTYWYISSITGGPTWDQSSIFYQSSGLSNGDSALVEILSGGPLITLNTDGSWIAADSLTFQGKGYNSTDGWSANWSDFAFEGVGYLIVDDRGAGSGASRRGRKSVYEEQDEQIRQDDESIVEAIRLFMQEQTQ